MVKNSLRDTLEQKKGSLVAPKRVSEQALKAKGFEPMLKPLESLFVGKLFCLNASFSGV